MPPTYTLRDGSTTSDVRLDRLVDFDERSRSYRLAVDPTYALRNRVWYLPRSRYLDQGQEGACVSAGITHELAARPVEITRRTMQWAREQIYWPAQRIDPWPGGAYPGASPFYEGTSVLAGLKVARDLGYYQGFRWALTDDERVAGIMDEGPAVTGSWWTEGMARPRPSGLVTTDGRDLGGHCTAWLGVLLGHRLPGEPRMDLAVIAQSWGLSHGDRGRVYVDLQDWLALLARDGETAFPVGRRRV